MEKDPNKMFKEISGKVSEEIVFLPKPDLNNSKKFQSLIAKKNPIPIYCNLFKMKITKNSLYYQYSISFTPEIEARNTRAKKFLIKQADEQIRVKLGYFLHNGDTLFSPVLLSDDVLEAIVRDEKLKIDYSILIKKTNEVVNVNDNAANSPASKILLELIIKEILSLNPNIEFYKNLFVKKNEKKVITGSGFKVDFFPGYTTSVVNTELGLYLNVQIKNKILSTATCLELIDQKMDKKANKAQNIAILKDYFVGRALRTVYSKRNYSVDDIAFDKTPANTTFNWNGKNITILNYYEVSHKIKIKDKNQPMFVQNKVDNDGKMNTLYLVPELCLLAGIDDEMVKDRDFMKNLANETKFKPDERVQKNANINILLNEKAKIEIKDKSGKVLKKLPSSFEMKTQNGIELENLQSNEFTSSYLNVPKIIADSKKPIPFDQKARYKVLRSIGLTNWLCVYHSKNFDDANNLLSSMQQACDGIGIKVADPEWVEMNSYAGADWLKEVDSFNPTKYQIVVFLLDRSTENLYKRIKEHSMSSRGYLSQVIKTFSLKKNALSVCSNLLKQINSKQGGANYAVDYDPLVKSSNYMVVGVDSSHISGKRTGVAMTASTDNNFLNFFNYVDIIEEKNKEKLVYCVRKFLEEAIQNYFQMNSKNKNKLPSGIVIYRQGVSIEQKEYLKYEIAEIENYLSGQGISNILKDNPIPFYYVLVNTKTNFKFFEAEKSKGQVYYSNPQQGFIIYDQVTNPDLFEFYLQPQFVTGGTATPSLFQVAYGNLNEPEMVMKLTYDLCYSYPNWNGPIRIPGPLKLAEKLAKMTAKYTKSQVNELLRNLLSFI